jgi:outer membrane lipoprotein-sorting protein
VAASPDGFKITYPATLSEDWVIANRQEVWTWQSQGQKITHATLPAKTPEVPGGTAQANERASGVQTPDQVAQDLLNKLQPTTTVTQLAPVSVAGQSAYQLQLTPKSTDSTPTYSMVDHVTIAVDGVTSMPLQVQVFPKGTSTPALEFGFSSVDYGVPPASTFTFTPPQGLKITEKNISAPQSGATPVPAGAPSSNGTKPVVLGQGWDTVAVLNNAGLPAQVRSVLQKGTDFLGGTLIHTTLFNVVVYETGKVIVGAVDTQSPLWAQAAGLS